MNFLNHDLTALIAKEMAISMIVRVDKRQLGVSQHGALHDIKTRPYC